MHTPKHIAILGSTGSIGTQTLDIVRQRPEHYDVRVLTAGSNVDVLVSQAREFMPEVVVIADETKYETLRNAVAPLGITAMAGNDALAEVASRDDVEMVVTATVGYSGLAPTIAAIKAEKDIALANKETLVVAGALINELLKTSKTRIYPVDSEHSAIYQCLEGEDPKAVRRLIITASGGPFRTTPKDQLQLMTAKDALRHPNWSMGAKITIDSATMLNKAFEIIEAHWLFDIEPQRISAVVHPQSIVHSMVEYIDGAIKAQLGTPDMHLPIAYALGEASRHQTQQPLLSLQQMSTLTFEEPDADRFPCIRLAHHALQHGGNTACIINAANEIAVAAFLQGQVAFTSIYSLIEDALQNIDFIQTPTYEQYVDTNRETRQYVSSLI